jgi:dTDP-4-amino-4,6-dideoxygalactose transaminase
MTISFNIPHATGSEITYISKAIANKKLCGDGWFTKQAQQRIEELLGSGRSFLTTSCTDALEAAAILCDIQPGDEVIVPSYTFVSTANAFALRGAKILFADSLSSHPNIDPASVSALITERTRAIVPVHYAGIACDMDALIDLTKGRDIKIVEDAAQSIAASYKGQPLGTLGDFGAFSFHETKNIICGEGGSLHVNRADAVTRAEIIREKGTNRSSFFRGEVDKYGWVDLGSSYLPSELVAAYLLAQLEQIDRIQDNRLRIWNRYDDRLRPMAALGHFDAAHIPNFASNNAHMYYLTLPNVSARSALIDHLKSKGIQAVFHYQSLHKSQYFADKHDGRSLPEADRYSDTLIRLPLFADLQLDQVDQICDVIMEFYKR